MSRISFEGIGEVAATFACAEGVQAGQVVKVTGDAQVGPCGAGDGFCGVALHVQDGHAAVQVAGFAAVPVSGAGVSAGAVKLSADGTGGVKADAAGRAYQVAAVDAGAGTAAVLL